MIICSSSNIDLVQGVSAYGTVADGATDWRIENTTSGVFNILNSPNVLTPNVSIIDSGNVGIGTVPVTGTNKLQVQGAASISGLTTANTITASGLITANAGVTVPSGQTLTTAGGHTANTITASGLITANAGVTVNTGSLTCANDTFSKTYTATNTTSGTNDIVTMRYDSTNGLRFTQTLVAANDVRYDIIQKTNNVDSTAPVLSFYKSNVGIGTTNPNAELQITNSTTATNPDTPGTAISLYVHNPTNSASQNSVIYNRIGGTSAGKVIYSFNVLSSYGCSLVINGNDTTNRLLRFNNSSDASGTDLMVINNSNGNVSIGNTDTATHKLNVTGDINVSGAFRVGGTVLKPATAVLADTATILATSRNIAGTAFNGSGNIDISYPNLTNKLTAGTGITISAATPPVISTNLTAGTNITFSGTAPNITINSTASGGSSQWVTSGANIYYNNGNVGIATASSIESKLTINPIVADRNTFDHSEAPLTITNTTPTSLTAINDPKAVLHLCRQGKSGETFGAKATFKLCRYTNDSSNSRSRLDITLAHNLYDDITAMSIASNGNIGIGTTAPQQPLHIHKNALAQDVRLSLTDNTSTADAWRGLHLIKGGDNIGYLYNYENTALIFATNNSERMRIASNGNIGIGTNNPLQKLTVNGDFKLKASDAAWDSEPGKGLYMRFWNENSSAYIQSIDRSNPGTKYPLYFEASDVTVAGNFSVLGGTKSWRIKHPILENKNLIHVCIEGPRADNLYRGRKQLINGECEVNLDLECNTTGGMTEGCFVLINKNIQVFVSNNETFDKVIGSVVGNKLTVTSDNVNASCFIDWLVIGERNDNEIINNASTSSNGSIIVEIDREEIPIRAPRTNYDTSNYDILEM
jgi:hypothetical protein